MHSAGDLIHAQEQYQQAKRRASLCFDRAWQTIAKHPLLQVQHGHSAHCNWHARSQAPQTRLATTNQVVHASYVHLSVRAAPNHGPFVAKQQQWRRMVSLAHHGDIPTKPIANLYQDGHRFVLSCQKHQCQSDDMRIQFEVPGSGVVKLLAWYHDSAQVIYALLVDDEGKVFNAKLQAKLHFNLLGQVQGVKAIAPVFTQSVFDHKAMVFMVVNHRIEARKLVSKLPLLWHHELKDGAAIHWLQYALGSIWARVCGPGFCHISQYDAMWGLSLGAQDQEKLQDTPRWHIQEDKLSLR